MKKFLKSNKIISILAAISLLVSILYTVSIRAPEWFYTAGDWFNLLFQIAVGFLVSFIFYITQVYLPQQKQQKLAYTCVYKRLQKIIRYMENIFTVLSDMYLSDAHNHNELTDAQLLTILHRITLTDRTKQLCPNRLTSTSNVVPENCLTVNELITANVLNTEHEIDNLFKYYVAYITPSLMETSENILGSVMHNFLVKKICCMPADFKFPAEEDTILLPYYKLMKELEKISQDYKN